jgi:hypothetical protein
MIKRYLSGFILGFCLVGLAGCGTAKVLVDYNSCEVHSEIQGKVPASCDPLELR